MSLPILLSSPDPAEAAEALFLQNFNCAQSVLAPFAAQYGLSLPTALKLAAPFGGGIARRGETCGAVSGALMALGLLRTTGLPEDKEATYALAQTFIARFTAQRGSLLCRDLLAVDISTPAGLEQAHQSGITRTVCPQVVRLAASLVVDLLATA